MKRNRINIRVGDGLWDQLAAAASAHGSSKTAIIEMALHHYFDPDEFVEPVDGQLLSRMDRFDTRQARMEAEIRLCAETLGQYVLYWLTLMEPVPEAEREAIHTLGRRRYDLFVEQVAQRMVHRSRLD